MGETMEGGVGGGVTFSPSLPLPSLVLFSLALSLAVTGALLPHFGALSLLYLYSVPCI